MSLTRICDVNDCEDDALFMVGVWNDDSSVLDDFVDVCGAKHAKEAISQWLSEARS